MDRDRAEPQVEDFPGERARAAVEATREHAALTTRAYDFVWDRTAPADGPFCTDPDGNVLMDWTGHVGAMPLGYDNSKITEPMAELDLPDPAKIAGQDFYVASEDGVPGPAELMERIVEISPDGMDTVMLTNSGAEAVENAVKICYDHTGGTRAVSFQGAFHGRTLGALSLNRSKAVYRRAFPEVAGVEDVPFCADRTCTRETCACGFFPDAEASALERLLDPDRGMIDPGEVAYVILEPIQGEGGYNFPSDAFAAEVARIGERLDAPLVVDEVQTGVGRSGEWWASNHYPFEPDVIASAKALRVGATVASESVFPDQRARLSSTWGGGDIVAAAQGALTIDAIREYDLMDNAVERGRQFRETFGDAAARLDPVTDVRGTGLLLAVEFDSEERRDAVKQAAFERGFLTMGCGYRTLRLLPPLDSTSREVELGADLLTAAVEAVA
ncbi:MAG: aminotransferase class III-fold pyridoxal phosphate-dependent enzyme [Haloarculaceae archaeon]